LISHDYLVRNEGGEPLVLYRGLTSNDVTYLELPAKPVAPGGESVVRLVSKTPKAEGNFHLTAEMATNDPNCPVITLSLSGTIRRPLAAKPARIVMPMLRKGARSEGTALIHSPVWKGFSVVDVKCTRPEITWEIQPANETSLREIGARSGCQVTVVVPSEIAKEDFFESLELDVQPDEPNTQRRSFTLDVSDDSYEGAVTLEGQALVADTVVNLGDVVQGQGTTQRLIMKIRDSHRDIAVRKIETYPQFLKVQVAPYSPGLKGRGLYQICIEVPPDAPECSYHGTRSGELRIHTDHPRVPVIRLMAGFSVIGNGEASITP
jgi:hypothetical protein